VKRWKLSAAELERALTEQVGVVALMFAARGDVTCSAAVAQGAPALAGALVNVARQNDSVRRTLETLAVGSAWSGVVTAAAGIAVPILAHHGVIPPGILGSAFGAAAPVVNLHAVADVAPGGTRDDSGADGVRQDAFGDASPAAPPVRARARSKASRPADSESGD
jgi:hypothetical protein